MENLTILEKRIIEQAQKRLNEIKAATDRERLTDLYSKSNQLTILTYVENNGLSIVAEKKIEELRHETEKVFIEILDRTDKVKQQRINRISSVLIGAAFGLALVFIGLI